MQLCMTLITSNVNGNLVIRSTQEVRENESVHKARVHAGACVCWGSGRPWGHTQWRCITVEMGENRYTPCLCECAVLCSHMDVTCGSAVSSWHPLRPVLAPSWSGTAAGGIPAPGPSGCPVVACAPQVVAG